MISSRINPIRSSLAVVLAFCLLSMSTGLECRQALSQVTEGEVSGTMTPGVAALDGLETGLMSLPAGNGRAEMMALNTTGGLPASPGPASAALGRASVAGVASVVSPALSAAAAKSETIAQSAGITLPLSAISRQGLAGRAQGSIAAPIGVQAAVHKEGGQISRWMKTLAPSLLSAKKLDSSTGEAAQDLGRRIMGEGRPAGLAPDPAVAGHDDGASRSGLRAAQESVGAGPSAASAALESAPRAYASMRSAPRYGFPSLLAGTAAAAGGLYGLTAYLTSTTPLAWGAAAAGVFLAGLAAGTVLIGAAHYGVYTTHENWHKLEHPRMNFIGHSLAYGSLLMGAGSLAWAHLGAGLKLPAFLGAGVVGSVKPSGPQASQKALGLKAMLKSWARRNLGTDSTGLLAELSLSGGASEASKVDRVRIYMKSRMVDAEAVYEFTYEVVLKDGRTWRAEEEHSEAEYRQALPEIPDHLSDLYKMSLEAYVRTIKEEIQKLGVVVEEPWLQGYQKARYYDRHGRPVEGYGR